MKIAASLLKSPRLGKEAVRFASVREFKRKARRLRVPRKIRASVALVLRHRERCPVGGDPRASRRSPDYRENEHCITGIGSEARTSHAQHEATSGWLYPPPRADTAGALPKHRSGTKLDADRREAAQQPREALPQRAWH